MYLELRLRYVTRHTLNLSSCHCALQENFSQVFCTSVMRHIRGISSGEMVAIIQSVANIALCCYPHVKMEIGNLIQITTTAPIFQQSHYFRQKYLEIASCAVSLLNNIWVRVEHSPLQEQNLQKNQLQFKHSTGRM